MKLVKIVSVFVLLIALMVVTLQNQASVKVHFLWLTGEVPAVILLFLTTAGGFLMGLLVPLLIREKQRRKDKKDKKEKDEAKKKSKTDEAKKESEDDEVNG